MTDRRQELYRLLGDLPPRDRPISVTRTSVEDRSAYRLERLLLDLNGVEPVPACFVTPIESAGPVPTILYHHTHSGDYVRGKEELLIGRESLASPPYAEALTAKGWAALCIDTWGFGQRRGRSESQIFKDMLWHGQVLWGMMVYDSLRAVDYLCSRSDVDAARLGTLGMSMGSTMAWWTAALDQRIKVCVDLCCLTDFQSLIETNGLDLHGLYYYVPGLLKHFTCAQINALIAPRPHLGLTGNRDELTPPAGLDRIDAELKQVYARCNAPDAWKLLRYDVGHAETPAMRGEVMAFLEKWL